MDVVDSFRYSELRRPRLSAGSARTVSAVPHSWASRVIARCPAAIPCLHTCSHTKTYIFDVRRRLYCASCRCSSPRRRPLLPRSDDVRATSPAPPTEASPAYAPLAPINSPPHKFAASASRVAHLRRPMRGSPPYTPARAAGASCTLPPPFHAMLACGFALPHRALSQAQLGYSPGPPTRVPGKQGWFRRLQVSSLAAQYARRRPAARRSCSAAPVVVDGLRPF